MTSNEAAAEQPPVRLDLIKLLRTCLRCSLGAQQYVLADMLGIAELLREAEASDDDGSGAESEASNVFSMKQEASIGDAAPLSPRRAALLSPEEKARRQQAIRESIVGSLDVDVKGVLDHKGGASAKDLVTNADCLVQKIIVAGLQNAFGGSEMMPFRIVGEEDDDGQQHDVDDEEGLDESKTSSALSNTVSLGKSENRKERRAIRKALRTYGDKVTLPFAEHLEHAFPGDTRFVVGDSMIELRQRIAVFVDPIDGTNAFVEGVLDVPMNLVGIVVDGEPVASVVNKVFVAGKRSLSFCVRQPRCNQNCNATPTPTSHFLVLNGEFYSPMVREHHHPHHQHHLDLPNSNPTTIVAPTSLRTALRVTYSETTKAAVLAKYLDSLGNVVRVPARGAGFKLMALVEAHVRAQQRRETENVNGAEEDVFADVFVCPPHTVKKWDTCAPQAFLIMLGGDIFDGQGKPIRYNLLTPSGAILVAAARASGDAEEAVKCRNTSLGDGIVAVNGLSMILTRAGGNDESSVGEDACRPELVATIVKQRLKW